MSSNEESDDEFQSADEDIDFEPNCRQKVVHKSEDLEVFETKNDNQKSDHLLPHFDENLKITSVENKEMKIEEKVEKCLEPTVETLFDRLNTNTKHSETENVCIKSEQNQIHIKTEEISGKTLIEKCNENKKEEKVVIKTRKLLRKGDRIREQINTEEVLDKEISIISSEEKSANLSEPTIEILKEENKLIDKTEEEVISDNVFDKTEENQIKEEKVVIKGRKLLRKADRLREQTNIEESEISEEKKIEVLNKLSNLSEREDNSSKWNNWFSDIKSAAITATSTTASHVSQASNRWSLNPKSLLTSAVSITSNVGSGISSVVENVSSVVDSAIGAPPPEQLAASINKDTKIENTNESHKQNTEKEEIQNKSSLGFGLFDYTLNRLESIGKKTIEVIVDDKQQRDLKTDKNLKKD